MKHLKAAVCIFVALVAAFSSCIFAFAANTSGEPLYYIAFDDEYYGDSIGNAYGFDSVEYINVTDSELVKGAMRLTFEKSPYVHMGSYNKTGYAGEFDPFFSLPLYEIDEDILCEDVIAVVITVRIPETSNHADRPMMFFDTDEYTVIDGDGDFTSAAGVYKKTDEFQNVIFYTQDIPKWEGILQNLRIDPFNVPNDNMDHFDIAGVAFFGNKRGAMRFDGDYIELAAGSENETSQAGFALTLFAASVASLGFAGLLQGKGKKIGALVLASVLLVSVLSACGGKTDLNKQPNVTEAPTEVPTPEPDNFIESRENDEYRYDVYERHVKITKYIGMKPEVTIPDTIDGLPVTVIGFKAFFRYYCHDDRDPRHQLGLEKLVVSDSVEIIEDYALAGLEECDSITFGKGLKVIGNNAVQNGFALRELKFTGNSLEKVGAWAFANCISIEKIELPASVKTVGAGAFLCCRSSEKLEFGEETTVGKGVQFGCTPVKNCTNIDKWLGKR